MSQCLPGRSRFKRLRPPERTLDLQYYLVHNEPSTRSLMRHVRAAADRGVRVRLLVDVGRQERLARIVGYIRPENAPMRHTAEKAGFHARPGSREDGEDLTVEIELPNPRDAAACGVG